MEKFAAYGFNKSHSAAYAQISYYTAWLKVHHTCAFMAALLTSEMGNQEKLLKYISCCKKTGFYRIFKSTQILILYSRTDQCDSGFAK